MIGIFPPSRENWALIAHAFQFFPVFTGLQWITSWYPMGKTSIESRYNLPGKYAWCVMESPSWIIVLYMMHAVPAQEQLAGLPWENWTMAGLYVTHYLYRSLLFPYLQPTMSEIHPLVAASAFAFQVCNAVSIGGWLAGYGPTTEHDWAGRQSAIQAGLVLWAWSLLAVVCHDDELREIRRLALRMQKAMADGKGRSVQGVKKFYVVPQNGLFYYILYPHFLCEWFEWAAFWMIGGWDCHPARTFLINEVATMLPRALHGRQWYLKRFGKERVDGRKAVIPALL